MLASDKLSQVAAVTAEQPAKNNMVLGPRVSAPQLHLLLYFIENNTQLVRAAVDCSASPQATAEKWQTISDILNERGLPKTIGRHSDWYGTIRCATLGSMTRNEPPQQRKPVGARIVHLYRRVKRNAFLPLRVPMNPVETVEPGQWQWCKRPRYCRASCDRLRQCTDTVFYLHRSKIDCD